MKSQLSLMVLFGGYVAAMACSSSSDDGGGGAGGEGGGAGGRGGGMANPGGAGGAQNSGGGGGKGGSGGSASGTGGSGGAAGMPSDAGASDAMNGDAAGDMSMSFFVTSTGNPNGNLGGIDAADAKCKTLATAAGQGSKTWRAYLSTDTGGPNGGPINAKDRIGNGPWYNAKGTLLAANLTALHALNGNADLFLDEKGMKVPGQWQGSPTPNVHDVLTGTNRDGTARTGFTCSNWTSNAANVKAWVGHSDGMGPGGSTTENYRPWNAVHENENCSNTAPRGGGGRIYCFAVR